MKKSYGNRVTSNAGHVLTNNHIDFTGCNIVHHPLPVGTVKVCSGPSVVNIEISDMEPCIVRIVLDNIPLRLNAGADNFIFSVIAGKPKVGSRLWPNFLLGLGSFPHNAGWQNNAFIIFGGTADCWA